MRIRIGRIIISLPALLAAAGFAIFMITNDGIPPASLRDAIGHLAYCYTLALVTALAVAGIFTFTDSRIGFARAELIMRLITATGLAGFTVGVILDHDTKWVLAGFAAAATAEQLVRWWELRTVILPALILTRRIE